MAIDCGEDEDVAYRRKTDTGGNVKLGHSSFSTETIRSTRLFGFMSLGDKGLIKREQ